MGEHSTYLFAMPSWKEGVGRLVDFGGTLDGYNFSRDPDSTSIEMDWRAVGNDMRSAIAQHVPEQDRRPR